MILFRERARKVATAPGGVAAIDARFGVALLRSTPVSQLRLCAYARAFYSLIRECFTWGVMGIFDLAKYQKKWKNSSMILFILHLIATCAKNILMAGGIGTSVGSLKSYAQRCRLPVQGWLTPFLLVGFMASQQILSASQVNPFLINE